MAAAADSKQAWQLESPEDPPPRNGIDLSKGFDCEVREGYLNWFLAAPELKNYAPTGRQAIIEGAKRAQRWQVSKVWAGRSIASVAGAFRQVFLEEPQAEILYDGPVSQDSPSEGSPPKSGPQQSGGDAAAPAPLPKAPETASSGPVRIEGFVQTACCKFVDRITFEAFEVDATNAGTSGAASSRGTAVAYVLFSRSVTGSFDWNVNQGRVERLVKALEAAADADAAGGRAASPDEGRTRQQSYGTAEEAK